jgi:uncharacterized small protein (DUF1192 family)
MSGLGNQGAYDLRLVKDVLAQKDAEIARLKAKLEAGRVELRQQWERMRDENLALKAEIERLQAEQVKMFKIYDALEQKERGQRARITELCDALEQQSCWSTKVELIKRARGGGQK